MAPVVLVGGPVEGDDLGPGRARGYSRRKAVGRQSCALLLEYSFQQTEAGEDTPRLAALNGYLYDSSCEAQMSMTFDSKRR